MSYEHIIYKTLSDPSFRDQLKTDPEQALNAHGITATPELVDSLKKFDWNQVNNVQQCSTAIPT